MRSSFRTGNGFHLIRDNSMLDVRIMWIMLSLITGVCGLVHFPYTASRLVLYYNRRRTDKKNSWCILIFLSVSYAATSDLKPCFIMTHRLSTKQCSLFSQKHVSWPHTHANKHTLFKQMHTNPSSIRGTGVVLFLHALFHRCASVY